MAFSYKKLIAGLNIVPKTASTSDSMGDLEVITGTTKLGYHNGTTTSPVVTESHSSTLTNKTIDSDNNTISNIVNANIKSSAAIAYSKLNLSGSIVNADINSSAAIDYSKLNLSSSIVNADISNSAGIARNKIATGTAGYVVFNDGISGGLTQEQYLNTIRGGLGTNASAFTGVVKASSGTFSAASLVNADIDAAAAIARSKIANGTANYVVINSGAGALSEEAFLNPTRGGTGVMNTGTLSWGASNLAITLSGATSVTFPTSGTFATLAGTEQFTNKDYDGGTASNSLRLTVPKNTLSNLNGLTRKEATIVYGTDTQTLYVDTGSTLNPIGGNWSVNSSTSLTGGGTIAISTTLGQQLWRVAGTSAVTLSNTPFGTSAPSNGTLLIIQGTDNTNTVSLTNNDAAKGCILNGNVTLRKYDAIKLQYNSTDDRYVEISRNF